MTHHNKKKPQQNEIGQEHKKEAKGVNDKNDGTSDIVATAATTQTHFGIIFGTSYSSWGKCYQVWHFQEQRHWRLQGQE